VTTPATSPSLLPASGLPEGELFARLETFREHDLATRGGRTWAYVYDTGRADIDRIAERAYVAFLHENGLDPTVFPSLLGLENEVVAIALAHLGGGPDGVGSFTSGGTESCMLAVKAARDRTRSRRTIGRGNLVLPCTAHAAFHKAARYFDLDTRVVEVDPVTFKADVDAVAAAIDDDTVAIVGSAPSYAHGVIDPIEALGQLALERDVWLHVDACVGGWLLPYLRRLGREVAPFDLAVPGVTSLSVDLHKYAYCPKGASLVLYRDREARRHQLFACADWTGYTVINPTIQSSKTGGALAAAWATLHHVGDDGYLDIARRTHEATRRLVAGIGAIDGLEVLGAPEMSMIAARADGFDVFEVIDLMKDRRWYVQPQLSYGPSPANVHFSVTATSLAVVAPMLDDLAACVALARDTPVDPGRQGLLAALRDLDPAAFTPEMYGQMLAMAGLGGGAQLPERMAEINAIMDALPPALKEQLLVAFLNDLFVPARPAPDGDASHDV
jgi:sphinganine-1-phosphate aldolase